MHYKEAWHCFFYPLVVSWLLFDSMSSLVPASQPTSSSGWRTDKVGTVANGIVQKEKYNKHRIIYLVQVLFSVARLTENRLDSLKQLFLRTEMYNRTLMYDVIIEEKAQWVSMLQILGSSSGLRSDKYVNIVSTSILKLQPVTSRQMAMFTNQTTNNLLSLQRFSGFLYPLKIVSLIFLMEP
ncbi:hypothetical protein KUTeg_023035 [Tegillarca granosa]|uniref:Uncharacterized protein n=1 Tax=Tegillarca granosa TaxID=220873 RepID=A0ABQ9E696_TEGGR|nr:hypothetical protein KUTeg_023035 [Tegillarca granosa]